jgi:hypothetical protein
MILLVLTIIISGSVLAQEQISTIDFKFGTGFAWMQSVKLTRFENVLTKKWNHLFSSSIGLNFGAGGDSWVRSLTVINGDLNGFLSPFGNQKKYNFKIGTGITFIHLRQAVVYELNEFLNLPNGEEVRKITTFTKRGIGFNIIIDQEVSIGKKYLLSGSFIMQPHIDKQSIYTYHFFGFFLRGGIKL